MQRRYSYVNLLCTLVDKWERKSISRWEEQDTKGMILQCSIVGIKSLNYTHGNLKGAA